MTAPLHEGWTPMTQDEIDDYNAIDLSGIDQAYADEVLFGLQLILSDMAEAWFSAKRAVA